MVGMGTQHKVTISEIAKKAGCSKTTVSFAFNFPERIGKGMREKILKIAEEEGYIPDPAARKLSMGRHMSIGFLLPLNIDEIFGNPYTIDVIRGVGRACQNHGYAFTVIPPMKSNINDALRLAMVDGIIAYGSIMDELAFSIIKKRKLPFVMVDGGIGEDYHSVSTDDEKSASMQMELALKSGHRRIAVLAQHAPGEARNGKDQTERRFLGYMKALAPYGMSLRDLTVIRTSTLRASGHAAATTIKDGGNGITCVIAMSDIQAIGLMQGFRQLGVKVPDDVSVIGFDNIREADLIVPGLTTIGQAGISKGAVAAETLLGLIDGKSPQRSIRMSFEPIMRESLKTL